jgi:Xaa-Pro aminopeptidase
VARGRPVTHRVDRLRGALDSLGAASFLVTNPVDVRWLTGFESSNAALVVGRDRVILLTDGRYQEAARAVEGVEVVPAERALTRDIGRRLGDLAEAPVAFQADHVTVAAREELSSGGAELVPARDVLVRLRAVKEEEELEAMRSAARIADDAYARLAREAFTGRTEADLAWTMERFLHEEGGDDVAFPVIVASGPNAAFPHHHPGERRVLSGETVIVDAGARLDGYCSDCTRTFATGELPDELRRAYALCRSAQEKALAAVRVGVAGHELDAIARREIEESGLAEVVHGLGHGVGLEVHELPVLRPEAEGGLVAGNVVTVEPGVYLPGRGGVRIEDLVVVGQDGVEVLTPFTKDLLTLD